jgi:hypothetical protein
MMKAIISLKLVFSEAKLIAVCLISMSTPPPATKDVYQRKSHEITTMMPFLSIHHVLQTQTHPLLISISHSLSLVVS